MCPFILLFILSQGFHTLLSPTSLVHHQYIACSPLTFSPLILTYKISGKTAIFQSISQSVEILLPGNRCQFGSNKLITVLTGLDVSYADKSIKIQFTHYILGTHLFFKGRLASFLFVVLYLFLKVRFLQ